MKKILTYSSYFIFGTLVNALIAVFILPISAMCDCLYNDIKVFMIFPGSIIAGALIIFLVNMRERSGVSRNKAFLKSLFWVTFVFFILNIIKEFIPAIL